MEGLALTGAWVDRDKGLISVIALEMGGSADLLAYLQPGEPVILMGPTGTPTEIPRDETVVLAGGGLGNAVLFSIGRALRAAGSKVIYFAGYKHLGDRYRIEDIEGASDVVVWCCDEAPGFEPRRKQDCAFVGNIVQAMLAYASGKLGSQSIPFTATDRIIAIGSDRMMAAVARARHEVLTPFLKPGIRPTLSVDVETQMPGELFTQMRTAFGLQRMLALEQQRGGASPAPALLTVRDVIEFATIDGARANQLDHKIGTLTPGKHADIIMLRTNTINVLPLNNAYGAIVLGMDTSNVDSVFVAGQARKLGGRLVGVDLARIQRLAEESRDYVVSQAGWPSTVFGGYLPGH
jgi:hypothetical protein